MAMFNPGIFRAYDIRGVYGDDFDAEFAGHLGARIASYLGASTIVIGRDGRTSSDDLAYAVIDGVMHVGSRVIDIGQVSTPQWHWAIAQLGAVGGIMVTASHNPTRYNGFKIVDRRSGLFDELGGDRLRQIYDSYPQIRRAGGTVEYSDIIPEYAAAVANAAGWQGQELQLAIDAPVSVRRALELIAPIAPDHGLAARFDPDGDRISFFENGRPIAPDWIFLLLADGLGLRPLVFDLLFSRAVREYAQLHGIPYLVTSVGHIGIVPAMRRLGAPLGAEVSGHYYWRQFGDSEMPELVLLHIMRIVRERGTDMPALAETYARYAKSEILNIPIRDRKAGMRAIDKLDKLYSRCDRSRLDGLTVDCWERGGWWFTIRPSNTEPVLRLVVETKKPDLLVEKVHEILAAISRWGDAS
jgi:phosphomannomutase